MQAPAPDGKRGAEEETVKAGKLLVLCANVSEQETIRPRRRTARTLSVDSACPRALLGRTMSDGTPSRWHGRVARGGLRDGGSAAFRESPRASVSPSDRTRRRRISVDGAPVRASSGPERVTVEESIHSATRNFTRGPAFISSAKKHLPPTPGAGSTPTTLRPTSWEGNSGFDLRRTRSDAPTSLHKHLPPTPGSGSPLPPGSGSPFTSLRPSFSPGSGSPLTSLHPSSWAGNSVSEFRRTTNHRPSSSLQRQETRLNVQSERAWVRHSLRRASLVRDDGVMLGSADHVLVL